LFPLIERYLEDGKSIDQSFVNEAIALFERTFPKATEETDILMNSVQLYANTEIEDELDAISSGIHTYFNIRSMWFSMPILTPESKESFEKKELTKLFIIDSDNTNTLLGLQEAFPDLNIQTTLNTIDVLRDENSKSTLIIMNLDSITKLDDAYKRLSTITYLENGMNYEF
jgi:hypothetical protein